MCIRDRLCGSGLHCVNLAAKLIASGDADIIIAGGTENMSRAPYLVQQGRFGYRMGNAPLEDSLLKDALTDAFHGYHMGTVSYTHLDVYKRQVWRSRQG